MMRGAIVFSPESQGSHMSAIVQTHALSKSYGKRTGKLALRDLSLSVERGDIFGYLGPNGAGKTTTIKILLDLIRASSGSASLFGLDSRRDSVAIRQRLGFLPGDLALWENLTGRHIIEYTAKLRGQRETRFADELSQRLDFDPTKKVRAYSTGNRRKLGLILALMHKPELLILDEPTNGLDPLMQQIFLQLMREAKANGQTVFLSSHMLSEVQAICDTVGILRDGVLQAVQPTHELIRSNFHWVTLTLRETASGEFLTHLPAVSDMSHENGSLKFRLSGDFDPLLRALSASSQYVQALTVQEPTLEEVFLTYYSGDTAKVGSPS
jgi:ABC-2 type transport system ATP-binding protein